MHFVIQIFAFNALSLSCIRHGVWSVKHPALAVLHNFPVSSKEIGQLNKRCVYNYD